MPKIANTIVAAVGTASDGHGRLVYYGSAIGNCKQVNIEVIVQYSRRTKGKEHDAGKGHKIGVITAFCKGQKNNKCPNWVNE